MLLADLKTCYTSILLSLGFLNNVCQEKHITKELAWSHGGKYSWSKDKAQTGTSENFVQKEN